ncbi:MAG: sigma-70 family RNA polymerase sigma factor [Myxococcales bacterium]|nr:sigma-70 family RNA polymerase sigma factor [Myxococcales bacterium]
MTATAHKPMANDDSERDDQALVARFQRGDRAAFELLVRRYQRPIYWLALRYVGNDADAKDVAQRALVQAFVKVGQLRDAASFRSWVYRMAANLSLNVVRDRKPSTELADDLATALAREPLVEPMIEVEAQRRLRAAVAKLPPMQRLVVELRIYEELPFAEVAEIAECSEGSAKVNFHHALKKLRVLMNEEGES